MDAPIVRNLQSVRSRLDAAARRAGRDPTTVRLIAVSKTFSADAVRTARSAGQIDFGENKVQEGLQKIGATADIKIRWHLIGHLQSNKAKKAGAAFAAIHSVDSSDLVQRLDRRRPTHRTEGRGDQTHGHGRVPGLRPADERARQPDGARLTVAAFSTRPCRHGPRSRR